MKSADARANGRWTEAEASWDLGLGSVCLSESSCIKKCSQGLRVMASLGWLRIDLRTGLGISQGLNQ